jgi:hypothetical protein
MTSGILSTSNRLAAASVKRWPRRLHPAWLNLSLAELGRPDLVWNYSNYMISAVQHRGTGYKLAG